MERVYTIGEASAELGMPASTLRYYGKKGLFPDDIVKYARRRYPVSFRDFTGGVVSEDRQIPRLSDRPNSFSIRLGRNPVGVPSVLVGVLQEGSSIRR